MARYVDDILIYDQDISKLDVEFEEFNKTDQNMKYTIEK